MMESKEMKAFLDAHPTARIAQRTPAWRRARLGRFTGSRMHELMAASRGGDGFGKTAMAYINFVAGERDLLPAIIDNEDAWQAYHELEDVTNKFMRHGTEWEDDARRAVERHTGRKIEQCGFLTLSDNIGASPDGIIFNADGVVESIVEIKCPRNHTHTAYWMLRNGDDLKKEKPEYWWQMQTEMIVTGAKKGLFASYNPFRMHSLHVVEVEADGDAMQAILTRAAKAEKIIEEIQIMYEISD